MSSADLLAHSPPRRWASTLLRLAGWRVELTPPPEPRCLLIVYPHTSNWDFLVGILAKWSCGWPAHWLAKHTLFRGPFGPLLRYWGGIPVNRNAPGGFVEDLAARIKARESAILVIAPEGTRRYQEYWKSGFMRIALAAQLPVGLIAFDYRKRCVKLLEYVDLTGDVKADMAHVARLYEGVEGRIPSQAGPIRLRG